MCQWYRYFLFFFISMLVVACSGGGGDNNGDDATNTNQAATVSIILDQRVISGELFEFMPDVTDDDFENLQFDGVNLPEWLQVDQANGQLFGSPDFEQLGIYRHCIFAFKTAKILLKECIRSLHCIIFRKECTQVLPLQQLSQRGWSQCADSWNYAVNRQ